MIYEPGCIRKDGNRSLAVVPVTARCDEKRIRAAGWDGYIANPFAIWRSS